MLNRIGISGPPGSGKTTVAKLLSERTSMKLYSMGMLFREIAKEKGLSLNELSSIAEEDRSIDELIDKRQIEILKSTGVIMDSRLSCWLMERSSMSGSELKVWITAPFEVRAERIAKREGKSTEEVKDLLRHRESSEAVRYKTYYGIDIRDVSIYDIVINNSWLSAEECCDILLSAMKVE